MVLFILFFKPFLILSFLCLVFHVYLFFFLSFFYKYSKTAMILSFEYMFFCLGFILFFFFSFISFVISFIIAFLFWFIMHMRYMLFFVILWYFGASWYVMGMLAYSWYMYFPMEWLLEMGEGLGDMITNYYRLFSTHFFNSSWRLQNAYLQIIEVVDLHNYSHKHILNWRLER